MSPSCDSLRRIGSLVLDGEASATQTDTWVAHMGGCGGCAVWARDSERVRRELRLAPAAVTTPVVVTLPPARAGWVRWALAAVALVQLLLALASLVHGRHELHEAGAGDIALALGALAVVWRPSRAAGLITVAASFAVLLLVTAAADVLRHETGVAHEWPHVLVLAETALLSVMTRRGGPQRRTPPPVERSLDVAA